MSRDIATQAVPLFVGLPHPGPSSTIRTSFEAGLHGGGAESECIGLLCGRG